MSQKGLKKWDGKGMTQNDLMEKDTVLVLDFNDNVIGSESKRGSHEFKPSQPRGVLHRAFSVFLFDETTGELLLQKRASTKITFPNVRKEKLLFCCLREEALTSSLCSHTKSHRYGRIHVAHTHCMVWSHPN